MAGIEMLLPCKLEFGAVKSPSIFLALLLFSAMSPSFSKISVRFSPESCALASLSFLSKSFQVQDQLQQECSYPCSCSYEKEENTKENMESSMSQYRDSFMWIEEERNRRREIRTPRGREGSNYKKKKRRVLVIKQINRRRWEREFSKIIKRKRKIFLFLF